MKLCLKIATVAVVLAFACSACTDGSRLDPTRLSFPVEDINTALASEQRSNSSLMDLVSRGPEVLSVVHVGTPGFSGQRAAYSPDSGATWEPVMFDGNADPGMALYNLPATRDGQWLLLGNRNGQVFAFTSSNGREFSLQPTPVLDTAGLDLNAAVGTAQGWLIATSPDADSSNSTAPMLHQSIDGATWTARDGTAAGLPPTQGSFHPLSMAAGPAAILLVGQQVNPDRPPFAKAFYSTDGGGTWQDANPDMQGIGPAGNAFWTAAWTGKEFRVTGHAWPADRWPKQYPLGMSGSWTPGGPWQLTVDTGWTNQAQDIPRQSKVAYSPMGAIATQVIGRPASGKPKVLHQQPGGPWSEVHMPEPTESGLRRYAGVSAVADGFLVAGSDSRRGNDHMMLWHVDGNGSVTDRTAALEAAAPLGDSSRDPVVTSFTSRNGRLLAFGSVNSQPTIWEMGGDRNFSKHTALVSAANQTLDTMASGPRGLMLLGSNRAAQGHLPVLWSRTGDGEWSVYTGNIFGAEAENGRSPVQAVLPSSHGFIAAGSFRTDGANHAGIAVSDDGTKWSHIQAAELRGKQSANRHIWALAETPASTVLAGGSVSDGLSSTATVWTSPDAQAWTPVFLPRADGYTNASVVSLTAGPSRTVAVVSQSTSGKPTRYSTLSSSDNGMTWEPGTDLDPPSTDQGTEVPHVALHGEGFVLLTAQGPPLRRTPVLMVSRDGKQFVARPMSHPALEKEHLSFSALEVAADKLMVAGSTGPADRRESFGISIDVPRP